MLLAAIIAFLLIGNWFFTDSFVFLPVNLLYRLSSLGWWTLAIASISFIAWCISDD
ncbi:MAG: hypothetical protein AAFQ41_06405 [Cyanobacteria bacterium J06623_7]